MKCYSQNPSGVLTEHGLVDLATAWELLTTFPNLPAVKDLRTNMERMYPCRALIGFQDISGSFLEVGVLSDGQFQVRFERMVSKSILGIGTQGWQTVESGAASVESALELVKLFFSKSWDQLADELLRAAGA